MTSVQTAFTCADPEGDRGPGPPGKSQNIGFLSNTGPDPLKNHKATLYQASIHCRDIISTPAKRHLNGVSLAADDDPQKVVF